MKVIFSRKGWDSDCGGGPSLIFEDGAMLSLPIPETDGVPYSGLRARGSTYTDLMRQHGITSVRQPGIGRIPVEDATARLDPDLTSATVDRNPGWRPVFGQCDSAQGHLRNQGVGVGDLFLFFGYFSPTRERRLAPHGQRFQALWGYMEIGSILSVGKDPVPEWAQDHPHFRHRNDPHFARSNTIYVGADRLSLCDHLPGAQTLGCFRSNLRLTKRGATPSVWSLPAAFHPSNTVRPLTYHDEGAWTLDGDWVTLQTVGRGQEFVVEANQGILEWVSETIAPD